jgi:Divergent InlB B-repeat domain
VLLALPTVLAGAALLCSAGGASASAKVDYGMTVTVSGPGTITGPGINCRESSGDCAELFAPGTVVTLTETPDSGATFAGWDGFGGCSGTGNTCTITMNDNKSVTADFTGGASTQTLTVSVTGNGTVTGNGINCGNGNTDCSESYTTGTNVTLTETPASGNTFSGWGGPCSGTGSTCTVTMSTGQSVTATFAGSSSTATLTVTVTGNGKVTGPGINCGNGSTDCSESFATGTTVTLAESPASGATFSAWGGSCSGSATTCTVTMNASKGVSATFSGSSAQVTLGVTVTGSGRVTGPGINCGLGNTDCSEVFAANTSVTLAETPASGASFAGWGGACSGQTSTCTVVLNASKSLTASFSQNSTQKILNVSVAGSGRVSGPGISCGVSTHDCSSAFNDGTIVTLIATPASGSVFLGWGGACSGTQTTCQVLMNKPRAVSASFSRPGSNTGVFAARSLSNPIVTRTAVGWAVSLRFFVNRPASALLRMSLNGRLVNAFTFSPHAGTVMVGPFNVGTPGTYTFRLTLSDANGNVSELVWNVCISDSGCGAFRPAAFVRQGGATVSRTGNGWIIRVHFRAGSGGAANVRLVRAGRTLSSGNFTFHAGAVTITIPARQRGFQTVVLTARNASGRTVQARWNVNLF